MPERFNQAAETWDQNSTKVRLAHAIADGILKKIPLNAKMHLMDFGAGTGLLSEPIISRIGRLTAVDLSEKMLQQLQAKPAFKHKAETLCRDILAHPLAQRFEGIISAMALHHVENTRLLLRTFAAHLRPGGFIALADLDSEDGSFHSHGNEGVFHFGFEREALKKLLEGCGFENIAFETVFVFEKKRASYPVFLLTAYYRP